MTAPRKTLAAPAQGFGPFLIFGIGAAVAAFWAVWEAWAYLPVPNFVPAELPTAVGLVVAVGVFFLAGALAPPND